MRSLSDRGPALAALALAVLASACVRQGGPGVQVKALQADLVFGVKPVSQVALPPSFATLPQLPPLLPPPDLSFQPPKYIGPPLTKAQKCPPAGLNSFPKEPAARTVLATRRPALGDYVWVHQGTHQGADTLGFTLPLTGFETRTVKNLVQTSATQFSFDTVQKDLVTREIVTTTWQVKTDGLTTQGAVVPPIAVPEPPAAGEPERGIVLKKIVRTDAKGVVKSQFAPVVGVLVLPLPVHVTEQFTASAVDPVSFQTLQYQATVQPAARFNACGEIVEGWVVSGTLASSSTRPDQTYSETWTPAFAPQLGGLLVNEKIDQTGAGSFLKVESTIGQLVPTKAGS